MLGCQSAHRTSSVQPGAEREASGLGPRNVLGGGTPEVPPVCASE
jgi:hypothetical protein